MTDPSPVPAADKPTTGPTRYAPSLPLAPSRPAAQAVDAIREKIVAMPDATYPSVVATRRQWIDLLRWLSS